jgi:hypothetical protein
MVNLEEKAQILSEKLLSGIAEGADRAAKQRLLGYMAGPTIPSAQGWKAKLAAELFAQADTVAPAR